VRASLSSRSPANFECCRWSTYASYCTFHGVSHQIAGPKTAPCRPGRTIARLTRLGFQLARYTVEPVEYASRTESHQLHHQQVQASVTPRFARRLRCSSFIKPAACALGSGLPAHSARSASTVSTRAARAAGITDAKTAAVRMTAADPINGTGPGSRSSCT